MATKTPAGRTPLMAGNWKMNLDHLQATHLVQKLDWTLRDGKHDFGAVEVAGSAVFKGGTLESYKANISAIRNAAASARGEAI